MFVKHFNVKTISVKNTKNFSVKHITVKNATKVY